MSSNQIEKLVCLFFVCWSVEGFAVNSAESKASDPTKVEAPIDTTQTKQIVPEAQAKVADKPKDEIKDLGENKSPQKEGKKDVPLPFFVVDQELKISDPQINFDMKSSNGEKLKLGQLEVTKDSLVATLKESSLNLKWDARLIKSGYLTMFDRLGKSIWESEISSIGEWTSEKFQSKNAPPLPLAEKFRLCLTEGNKREFSSLCSQWYSVKSENGEQSLVPVPSELLPRVILNNEESRLADIKKLSIGDKVQFFAVLKSETTYEFVATTLKPEILDMIESDQDFNLVDLTGQVPSPLTVIAQEYPKILYGKFTKSFGLEDTILPNPTLWKASIEKKTSHLYFPGSGGGVFEYPVVIENSPTKSDRRYVTKNPIDGTYKNNDRIEYWPERQVDAKPDSKIWELSAENKYKYNRNFLDIEGTNGKQHKAYLDVYRGTSGEASLRLTGVLQDGNELVVLGEGHVSWWFNDLFGWQNSYLSKQRWGIEIKHFTALTDVQAKTEDNQTESTDLSVTDINLKYRFTPGLWERHETFGAILSRESGTFGRYDVAKLGVGLFWARSMPRALDELFNKLAVFRYPKWVDVEVINYMSSMTSGVTLQNDFIVNFHGKVMWTDRFFGEAGFGYKRYAFTLDKNDEKFNTQTLFGTVGVGLKF